MIGEKCAHMILEDARAGAIGQRAA
jgi:hypothetical protein